MTRLLGSYSLYVALGVAVFGAFALMLGARRQRADLLRSGELALYAVWGLVTVATLSMVYALVAHDFSVKYVAMVGSRATPLFYTVISLWGALEGSILFWIFVLTAANLGWQIHQTWEIFHTVDLEGIWSTWGYVSEIIRLGAVATLPLAALLGFVLWRRLRFGSSELVLECARGSHSLLWLDGREARRFALGLDRSGTLSVARRSPRLPVRIAVRARGREQPVHERAHHLARHHVARADGGVAGMRVRDAFEHLVLRGGAALGDAIEQLLQ